MNMDLLRPEHSSTESLEGDRVVVQARHLGDFDHRGVDRVQGGAGDIAHIGDRAESFSVGDRVLFLLAPNSEDQQTDTSFRVVAGRHCWITPKPRFLPYEEAASLPHAFAVAAVTVCSILHETLPNLLDRLQTCSRDQTERTITEHRDRAILVVGGDTLVGAAIVQLLRLTVPDLFLVTSIGPGLSSLHNESELTQLAIDQVLLGADFSIEHEARPDPENDAEGLNHELRSALDGNNLTGLECIVDTLGDLGGRGDDLLDLFPVGSRSRVFDVSPATSGSGAAEASVDLSRDRIMAMQGAEQLMATLGALLQADKFRLPQRISDSS